MSCWYSFESPHQGHSNVHYIFFNGEIRKNLTIFLVKIKTNKKGAFENVQNAQIQIVLHMHKDHLGLCSPYIFVGLVA